MALATDDVMWSAESSGRAGTQKRETAAMLYQPYVSAKMGLSLPEQKGPWQVPNDRSVWSLFLVPASE